MKSVEFNPVGVCSKKMVVECDENEVITKVQIVGGCPGNTLGVSKLCLGRKIDEVIELLDGNLDIETITVEIDSTKIFNKETDFEHIKHLINVELQNADALARV